uniref:Hau-lamin2 n=1 Tax=Helobdella sp. Austin TaxID=1071216 RepID=G5DCZ7_9ANNE|nr:Hau-lamin2 [Helobdella sp. Austin]
MSNRSKKSTASSSTIVTKSSTTTSTPLSASQSFRSTPGSNRPPSPTVLSRLQEKNELAGLNDRLANYIERVRTLEVENGRLTRIITSKDECVVKETSKIKGMFEEELASARKLLDDVSKEKVKLQVETLTQKKEIEELKDRLKIRDGDLALATQKTASAEAQVADLQARLGDALAMRKHWEEEFNKMKKELDNANRNLAAAKKNLEEEMVSRIDLENRFQSFKEDMDFKDRLHRQEISETITKSHVVVEETDHRLQDEYDSRLMEALQQIRAENEDQIRSMRLETEAVFEKKYAELRDAASRNEGNSEKNLSDLKNSKKRIEELLIDVSRLNNKLHDYETIIRDLEIRLKAAKDEHAAELDSLNVQIRLLKKTIEEQMEEYRDLMDTKIKLDTEIAAYRKLLESEESRLKGVVGVRYSSGGSDSSRKRKRYDDDESERFSSRLLDGSDVGADTSVASMATSSEFVCSSVTNDIVKFEAVDPEGKFIKLSNTSDEKELALGGWQLKHSSGDNETTYKFHRNLLLKPGSTVTVWSADADRVHAPPSDLVMKGQSWHVAEVNNTVLLDQKGDEVATFEMKKSLVKVSSLSSTSFSNGDNSVLQSKNSSKGWLSFLG